MSGTTLPVQKYKTELEPIVAALASRFRVNYLLSWCDVGIDVFEDRLEHGIVAHGQVLDLNLATLGPVLGHLRGVCSETNTGNCSN